VLQAFRLSPPQSDTLAIAWRAPSGTALKCGHCLFRSATEAVVECSHGCDVHAAKMTLRAPLVPLLHEAEGPGVRRPVVVERRRHAARPREGLFVPLHALVREGVCADGSSSMSCLINIGTVSQRVPSVIVCCLVAVRFCQLQSTWSPLSNVSFNFVNHAPQSYPEFAS